MGGVFLDMRGYSKGRIIAVILIVLVLVGVGVIWLLSETVSLGISIPIVLAVVAVIVAVLQWLVPTMPPSPLTAGRSSDIPETLREEIRRNIPGGTGAVIVKVNSNQVGEEFHLIPDKARILQSGSRNWRRLVSPNAVRSAVVRRHLEGVYAAVFEGLDPMDFLIWKGRLNSDISDPARRRGITVHPGHIEEVVFD